MATFKKGILGGFSGTVGTVVGSNWKGIEYMRSRPTTKSGIVSPAQEVHRLKFSLAGKIVRAFKSLFSITFKDTGNKMTGANSALSYTLKNAVTGVYPDLGIDYKMMLVARGALPNAISPVAAPIAGAVKYTWGNNSGTGIAADIDKAVLVAFHPPTNSTHFTIGGAEREDGTATLALPSLVGEDVETWLAFISANDKNVSPSIYTGKIKIA